MRGADGKRIGFDAVALDGGERAPLARMGSAGQSGPKVGQYSVNVREFEKIALRSLNEDALRGADLVIIDEVGKMDKDDPSKEFKELLSSLSIEVVNMFFSFRREKSLFVSCSPGDRHHH